MVPRPLDFDSSTILLEAVAQTEMCLEFLRDGKIDRGMAGRSLLKVWLEAFSRIDAVVAKAKSLH